MRTVHLHHSVEVEVEGIDDWHAESWAYLMKQLDIPEDAKGGWKGYDWLREAVIAEYTWVEHKDTYAGDAA